MRAGAWWVAASISLLSLAVALRTPQVEGDSRVGRRLTPTAPDTRQDYPDAEDVQTFRPRSSRRREETTATQHKSRTRIRPSEQSATGEDISSPQTHNDRYDSRRTNSRMRSRPVETETKEAPRRDVIRSRSRHRASTQTPLDTTSPFIDESKIEVVNSNLHELSRKTPVAVSSNQFRRRSSTSTTETTARRRGRINTRTNLKPSDLDVSGTTNTLIRDPTTARNDPDLRNSRKLRYKTRFSETDTNLTGEGFTASGITISSQNKAITTSQPEIKTVAPIIVVDMSSESSAQSSSESLPIETTTKRPERKVVKRPVLRGKGNFRPAVSLPKLTKSSDEINEDDNYPESFKALIQAKNASTHSSSPQSESLTVKASQKVYKTYTPTAQSTHNSPAKNKYSRFRSKINLEDDTKKEDVKEVENSSETTTASNKPKTKTPEYRPRGIYNPRSRNTSAFTSTTTEANISSNSSTVKPLYKFNRKFKVSTTARPNNLNNRLESNNVYKKSLPSYYSRRKNLASSEASNETTIANVESSESNPVSSKPVLPKTSYYSRLRNKFTNESVSPTEAIKEEIKVEAEGEKAPADKKEDAADMPLIFSLLSTEKTSTESVSKETSQPKEMFIIAVSSKESDESHKENEVKKEEKSENRHHTALPDTDNKIESSVKFHATYKNKPEDKYINKEEELVTQPTTPSIKNINKKRNGRRRPIQKENEEEVTTVTPKPRNIRKFSDTYSKTTEPSTNGIPPDPEKHKSRYSSKYRASNFDKQIYKPTVPTITPSTAWLKFFVTDRQLAKTVEDPKWLFEEEDNLFTTETSTNTITPPPISHESSIELVEGEEYVIGPDMNSISFTMPRSTLSSADLKLSESLVKPSHIQNIEASQHSASVTVSIFDALAEILTSTPRTSRISSTTQKQKTTNDSKQTQSGVSSNINVNNVSNFASQDTPTSVTDVNSVTKPVQVTYQTTQIVNNQLPVAESATPSLNTEGESVTPVHTPSTPTIPPSTPVSARRPFAIRVLYTESPIDKQTVIESTSNQPSTDSPATVYNTVSDLLLTNNHLVSSELTSMLSNNILDIIKSMDVESRSKISVDMAKLLKSLIPRALNNFNTSINDDTDSGLNTTPYSLEEIKDTENVDIEDKIKTNPDLESFLQTVEPVQNVVNNTNFDASTSITRIPTTAVNSPSVSLGTGSTLPTTNSQTTEAMNVLTTELPKLTTHSLRTFSLTSDISNAPSSVSLNLNPTDINIPVPLYTKNPSNDITPVKSESLVDSLDTTQIQSIPLYTRSIIPKPINNNNILSNPSQVSPLQLWVLSKKAKVLQMIEDLIRQHNEELATATPLTEMLSQVNNIPLSNRLTEIINTMTSTTTESTDRRTENVLTSPMTTPSFPLTILSTTETQTDPTTGSALDIAFQNILSTTDSALASKDVLSTSTELPYELSSQSGETSILVETTGTTETSETPTSSSVEVINRIGQSTATPYTTVASSTTSEDITETSTLSINDEPTTITESITTVDITTPADTENTTNTPQIGTKSNVELASSDSELNDGRQPIPKKDYVIFGILPNNTVVRKDPNDDPLETLTEASPYIVYGVLPNNTIIRKFPNGTRVPRVMQKVEVLPISPWSLRNPYSPIHNNPAIVRPKSNPIRVSTNTVTSTDTLNGTEYITNDTVNNQQNMIPSALNIKGSSSLGVTPTTNKPPAEKSTASHVLSLRTSTMLPSVDEILLNSISSAVKEEMVISSMMSSTHEPRILTLDIDPETQQIRTEKPADGKGSAVFKFIPIDEIMVAPQDTNVLKLATKTPSTSNTVTDVNTQTPQIQTQNPFDDTITTSVTIKTGENSPLDVFTNSPIYTESATSSPIATTDFTTSAQTPTTTILTTFTSSTTEDDRIRKYQEEIALLQRLLQGTERSPKQLNIFSNTNQISSDTTTPFVTSTPVSTTTTQTESIPMLTTTISSTTAPKTTAFTSSHADQEKIKKYEEELALLKSLLQGTERTPKRLNTFGSTNQVVMDSSTSSSTTTQFSSTYQDSEEARLLRAILAANKKPTTLTIPNIGGNIRVSSTPQTTIRTPSTTRMTTTTQTTTTERSLEEEIRQFEEDTKLLKALLAATGQNPANLNIPSLESLNLPIKTTTPVTSTTTRQTTITTLPTTTNRIVTSTQTINDDIRKLNEDARLLQALKATSQNNNNANRPIVTAVTSNVRVASNPLTTAIVSQTTTPMNIRPVYTSRTTTPTSTIFTSAPPTVPSSTFQPRTPPSTTEEARVTTTVRPNHRRRQPTTTAKTIQTTLMGRRAPSRVTTVTTEIPSTSTFSDEEDLLFLQNLKSVLNTSPSSEDPESALANRIIALAVERSLNEIQSNKQADVGRTGKNLGTTVPYRAPTTTTSRTTTTRLTTTTTTTTSTTTLRPTTTSKGNTPSLEEDIKQFQEDTKLLQALLKATGQDPSKFNIPTLPTTVTSTKVSSAKTGANDLKLLSNLLASPSPLNEPFDSLTQKPTAKPTVVITTAPSTPKPFGAKIAVKDNLKNENDDAKLLQTLIKLQGVQETTTQRSKLTITGQSPDEALKKLIQQTKSTGMMSDATKMPISISTEYGKSNDALLAALLKEQGFGPTTASSLDEQLRLAALLNQVVVTPKARRTTTPPPPPPPPPPPRRPILDGLAWLWQQWRETGPGPTAGRPNRRPSPSSPTASSSASDTRVSWFGSGPFVGNADDGPSQSNRVPLEPPRAVVAEQAPGRGQLVSAAINVTRAFSQFLGAAIQGAAQTVQSVIRAGQRAATDVYTNGSG